MQKQYNQSKNIHFRIQENSIKYQNILSNFQYIDTSQFSYIGFTDKYDKPHGYGIYIDNERCLIYEGIFIDGIKSGDYYQYDINYNFDNITKDTFKIVKYQDNSFISEQECFFNTYPLQSEKMCYVGHVNKNGQVQGIGKIIYRNKKMITGTFKDGKLNGIGITFTQQDLAFQLDFYLNDQRIYQIAKYNKNWKQYYIQAKYEHNQYVERTWTVQDLEFKYIGKVNFLDKANGYGLLQIVDIHNDTNMLIIGQFDKHSMKGYYHVISNGCKYKIMYIKCDQIENIQTENMKEQQLQHTQQQFDSIILTQLNPDEKNQRLQCIIDKNSINLATIQDDYIIQDSFQTSIDKQQLKEHKLQFRLLYLDKKRKQSQIFDRNFKNVYQFFCNDDNYIKQMTNGQYLLYRYKDIYDENLEQTSYFRIDRNFKIEILNFKLSQ